MTFSPLKLRLNQWQPLNDLLLQLQGRLSVHDGGAFILEHWDCKYIDIRLDMRVGATYARPGSGPESVYTKLAQMERELAEVRAELATHEPWRAGDVACNCGGGHMLADHQSHLPGCPQRLGGTRG